MFRENRAKKLMRAGKLVIGAHATFADPAVVEIIGLAGYDAVFIDMEHSGFDLSLVGQMIRAADVVGITSIVRVPDSSPKFILRVLEMGAQGISVPHIDGLEDAKRAVDAVRFPPLGERGAGGSTRAARYGSVPWQEYLQHADEQILLGVFIEDQKAIAKVEEIAAVEGIDLISLGPRDLSLALGSTGPKDPAFAKAVEDLCARVRKIGKAKLSIPMNHPSLPLTPKDLLRLGIGYSNVAQQPTTIVFNALQKTLQGIRADLGTAA